MDSRKFAGDANGRTSQFEKRAKRRAIRKLHTAVEQSNLEEVLSLLTPDVDVNFHYNGKTALQIAVVHGFDQICEVLINNGADVDKYNAEENSLLNMACWHGYSDIVSLLLHHSANPDTINNHGSTPLNTAAYRGFHRIVKSLVEADCDINRCNNRGQCPLVTASREGWTQIVTELIQGKCDLNLVDNDGRSALVMAAQKGHADITNLLIEAGCNLNIQEKYGRTALYMAAKHGHLPVVSQLIQAGADLNIPDTKGCSPFWEAVQERYEDIVILLSKNECKVNTQDHEMKQAPIHVAVRLACQVFGETAETVSMVKTLIRASCDLNLADRAGWTPLYQSTFGGEVEISLLLLAENVRLDTETEYGDTPLHGAVFGNRPQVVECLIKQGSNVNAVNKRNELPIYTCITLRGKIEIIKLLLDAGSRTDICEKENHQSPLFAAIQHNYTESIKLLIEKGADVNLPNSSGDSPLWVACDKGSEETVDLLLGHPDIDVDAGVTHIPLHAAAVHGYLTIAEKLLRFGCNVNKMTEICATALQLAADTNQVAMVKLLIQWGANPSAPHDVKLPRKCCKTYSDAHPHLELEPLYAAVKNDNFLLVKFIIAASPKMPFGVLRTLCDLLFRTDYIQEARLEHRLVLQYAHFFTGIQSRPRSLQEECRGIIRLCLGTKPFVKVGELPLPNKIQDYLLFSDIAILK